MEHALNTLPKSTALTPAWREWVVANLRRNCTAHSMVAAMTRDGFDPAFAAAVVAVLAAEAAPVASVASREPAAKAARNGAAGSHGSGEYVDEPSRIPAGNRIVASDRTVPVLARLEKPDLVLLGGLLSDDECAELIRLSEPKLARSTTVDPATGQEIVIDRRTSSGTYFHLGETELIARIDRRLAEVVNWPVDHGEGIQILRYREGGEYRPHFDYFPPQEAGSALHTAQGGQRVASVVIYLNDAPDGGATIFPEIGLSVTPHRGNAVYFGYCNSQNQLDPLTLHGGAPVGCGEKWIATKWLRKERRA